METASKELPLKEEKIKRIYLKENNTDLYS